MTKLFFLSLYEPFGCFSLNFVPGGGWPSVSAGGVFGVISGHKTISIEAILMKPFFLSLYEPFGGVSLHFVPGGGPRGQVGEYLGSFQTIKQFLLKRF